MKQGDPLSPLWFCLAINPSSDILNSSDYGFNIKIDKGMESKLSNPKIRTTILS
jgi:hypothetical protein